MIESIPFFIPIVGIGVLIMLSSFFYIGTRGVFFILLFGAAIAFSGIFFIPTPFPDFCEDNDGIYSLGHSMDLCSIPDADGEYIVYKVIKVNDELKFARFSELKAGGQLQ